MPQVRKIAKTLLIVEIKKLSLLIVIKNSSEPRVLNSGQPDLPQMLMRAGGEGETHPLFLGV